MHVYITFQLKKTFDSSKWTIAFFFVGSQRILNIFCIWEKCIYKHGGTTREVYVDLSCYINMIVSVAYFFFLSPILSIFFPLILILLLLLYIYISLSLSYAHTKSEGCNNNNSEIMTDQPIDQPTDRQIGES